LRAEWGVRKGVLTTGGEGKGRERGEGGGGTIHYVRKKGYICLKFTGHGAEGWAYAFRG